jgi:hypothetical protein
VHPDQSRNRLIFSGDGQKGIALPLSDWGLEFAENLPEPIYDAVRRARGDMSGSIEDEEYRKRLQDKFGQRWRIKVLVSRKNSTNDGLSVTGTQEDVEVSDDLIPVKDRPRSKRRRSIKIVLNRAIVGGVENGVEREVPVDVPRYEYATKDEFQKPWHLALWAPNAQGGPTVFINADSPILEEATRYHQELYPDVYAEEIAKVVRQVFGEVAACKIAHSQKLVREVSEQELDRDYRSEAALTVALMGLLAEESLIAQRLMRFGRKKAAA